MEEKQISTDNSFKYKFLKLDSSSVDFKFLKELLTQLYQTG